MGGYVITKAITMAMTNAEKQAAFRQRREARIAEMQEQLRNGGGEATEIADLRRELEQTKRTLSWARDLIKTLQASNKRLRNGWVAPIKEEEEPSPEPAALVWGENGVGDPEAVSPSGTYSIGADRPDKGRFATFFQPVPGPRGGRRQSQGVGNFTTLAEAKAACEENARAVT
jgi:hypothetical protein